jgi:glycosyltransferase involved in cell wall biosynthesis
MRGISVISCCYNSAGRIVPTLASLRQQITNGFDWEIIIVNNNSTDNTVDVARNSWNDAPDDIALRIIDEPKAGLKFAREAGINAAHFSYLVFVDDDNHLSPGYLQQVFEVFNNDESIALIGGLGTAKADVPLPDWFQEFGSLFATGKPVASDGQLQPGIGYIYGAGMALRKSTWNRLIAFGFRGAAVDRTGKVLSGGHDVEISHAFRLIGYKVVFDPALKFDHFMDAKRLNWNYTLALMHGSASNFIPFVYFIVMHRGVTSGAEFGYLYSKRVASELLRSFALKLRPLKNEREHQIMTIMNRASLRYLATHFGKAYAYFKHVNDIYKKSRKKK